MKNKLDPESSKGQMLVAGERATIIFKRTIHHAPELVWAAITNPEELKDWFMASSVRVDGKVGGIFEMIAGPARIQSTGKILAWEPSRLLEYEWKTAPRQELPAGEDCIVRWELAVQGDATLLILTFRGLTKPTALGFTPGLHVFLDRLSAQLNQSPRPDWMTRFSEVQALYPAWDR